MKIVALVSAACLSACGARTGLLAIESTRDASIGPVDAGSEARSSLEASHDATEATEATVDVRPRVLCRLVEKPTGEPIELLRFDLNNANAPQLVVLDPGASGSAERDATIAIQVFRSDGNDFTHPDIQIARAQVGADWPAEVILDRPPQLFGIESHGWGEMVHAPGADGVALAWHGDPGGRSRPIFRALDVPSWTESAPIDVVAEGEAVLAIAAGKGTRDGDYQGDGYAVVWRAISGTSDAEPRLTLLDRDGRPASGQGPFPIAAPSAYPGRNPAIVWSGETYLTATAFPGNCGTDPRCAPRSVVVGSVRPSKGSDTGGVTTAATFAAAIGGPTTARIASYAGLTWVAWFEGDPNATKGTLTLRIVRVGANGERLGSPFTITEYAHPQSRAAFLASETGLTLAWIEDGDTALPDDAPGRSRLVLVHGPIDDNAFDALPAVPITRFASYGIEPSLAAIQSPPGILAAYTARGSNGPLSPAWLVRFGCSPP